MIVPSRRRLLGWAALSPFLSSCSSPEPDYYRLVAVPGGTRAARPLRVELRQVGLARYLDRREIVRGGASVRLDIRDGERWAEPIGDMVTRVLAENLNQRLPGSLVVPEQNAVGGDPEVTAEADITRFEDDGTGRVVLEGRFQVRRLGGRAAGLNRQVAEVVPLPGSGTAALAQAMSTALGRLSDQMSEALSTTLATAVPTR
ncbi:PqiC family protein [Siccirubricoccus sp. KC 17139]|uniref:PqiC family protein n=1 Tax=Siccirubricoccus soli TaxID=2899147 RepID=A0ABT1D3N4_9PROT|nr:PqiC family protein [Siccirubricoccus soli]MCO6416543.1 PqiC family protein [Siccirubricoccus soli]MCP2682678.1 PqiC family protein [Siccirubricoccus soli]